MAKPTPPKIAPKPGKVTVLRALYDYTAQQEDELSFNEGDILYLVDQSNSSWYKARCGRKCGLIPSNYVELKTSTVENPLHDAARRGNVDFLKECLSNGVSPTGLDASGTTALHWSARGGHLDCVQELIRAAAKQDGDIHQFVNSQNKLGETPLHSAASKDHIPVVQALLENGGNPSIQNKHNQTPQDLCHDPLVKTTLQNWDYVAKNDDEDDDEGEYLSSSDEGEEENDGTLL